MNTNLKVVLSIALATVISISCEEPEDGLDGKDGLNGKDGTELLINTIQEPAGSNCDNGGTKLDVGYDTNANDVLDSDEIKKSIFICNGSNGNNEVEMLIESSNVSSGENCASGGIKLLIGYDLNNNEKLDIEEVDKISYICNGQDAMYAGKTYVILSGDITDAEAQAKLELEVGVNTQFVWIVGTTQLTNVDLTQIVELAELRIEENEALKMVDLRNLKHVFGEVEVNQNAIDSLKLNSLETVLGDMVISENRGLKMLDLKNLKRAHYIPIERNQDLATVVFGSLEMCDLQINGNAIKSLDFSMLTDAPDVSLYLWETDLMDLNLTNVISLEHLSIESTSLLDLDLASLTTADELDLSGNFENIDLSSLVAASEQISIAGCESLTDLNLSTLQSVDGVFIGECDVLAEINMSSLSDVDNLQLSALPSIVSVNLDGLKSANSNFYIHGTALKELNLGALESAGNIEIFANSEMTKVDMPSLVESGLLKIHNNSLLSQVDLTSLSSLNLGNELDRQLSLSSNSLSSESVNALLNTLANLNPNLTNAEIFLYQIPAAPPTGDGLTDKATLIANGNSVNTD